MSDNAREQTNLLINMSYTKLTIEMTLCFIIFINNHLDSMLKIIAFFSQTSLKQESKPLTDIETLN